MDLVNFYFYNPETVPNGDWGFFTSFLVGDFVMRFFFNASDSSNAITNSIV